MLAKIIFTFFEKINEKILSMRNLLNKNATKHEKSFV